MSINEILFIVSAIIGMVVHYVKKYVKGETTVSMYEWFGKANLPATIAAIGTLFTAIVSALASGLILPDASIWAVLYTGITTGIAVDSAANSDGEAKKLDTDTD
jgi:hypothetical protein